MFYYVFADRPVFLVPPPNIVDVQVGESHVLNLTAKANPGPVLYSWRKKGVSLLPLYSADVSNTWRSNTGSYGVDFADEIARNARVSADGPLLYLNRIALSDAGEYTLEAKNEQGSTIQKIYINVQCKYIKL